MLKDKNVKFLYALLHDTSFRISSFWSMREEDVGSLAKKEVSYTPTSNCILNYKVGENFGNIEITVSCYDSKDT